MKKLSNGINLNVLASDKFQSVKIVAEFYAPFSRETAASRALLAQLMTNSSEKFPNRQLLTKRLNQLYGAHFSVSSSRFGKLSRLRFSLKIPSPKAAGDPKLLAESLAFLSDQIYKPLMVHGLFPAHLFENEKKNFLADFLANFDNKSYKLHDLILKKYFLNPDFQIQAEGSLPAINGLSRQSLISAYQSMMSKDQMLLEVSGALRESEVERLVDAWPALSDEAADLSSPVYTQAVKTGISQEIHEKGDQTLLEQAYNFFDYDYLSDQRYTALVFSRLFGGSSQSLLFLTIREKLHLAYYANSFFFNVDGWMSVSAGLDKANIALVKKEIARQLTRIKKQDFSSDLLATVKEELIAATQAGEDDEDTGIEQSINTFLTAFHRSTEQVIGAVRDVTAEQIAAFAQKSVKQAEAVLINEN